MSMHLFGEVEILRKKFNRLGMQVEAALDAAIQSLVHRDKKSAEAVINADSEIDAMEVEVEEECLKALALYQPVAVDLRFVVAALKMNSDLERIGDLASNIAETALHFHNHPHVSCPFDAEEMALRTRDMLRVSLDSLMNVDVNKAMQVLEMDHWVDNRHRENYQIVTARIIENPKDTVHYLYYMGVSRYLERISDHATNLAEDVIYLAKGTIVRHDPELKK